MTDQLSNAGPAMKAELKNADDPALFQDVQGKFPVQKMIAMAKAGKLFNVTMKNMRIAGGAKFAHKVIEPKSKGGGVIQFVVGASRWEINFSFEDLEFSEKKEIIIHGS